MKQSVQVCIEEGCTINRIITNYEQICSHFALNHEIWSIEKLETKGNEKMKTFNEQAQNKAIKLIEDCIDKYHQNVIQEVKALFEKLKIHYLDQFKKKIKYTEKLDLITINNKQLVQKYVDACHDKHAYPSSPQLDAFVKQLESRMIFVQNDMSKELQVLLDYSKEDIQVETTTKIEQTPQIENELLNQAKHDNQQQVNKPMQYQYKYYENVEDIHNLNDQDQQQWQQKIISPYEQKQEVVEKAQPLRGYKQQQQFPVMQQPYQPKQYQQQQTDLQKEINPFLKEQNHDRINFALPSDKAQTTYVDTRKGKPAEYESVESPYSEKQEQKQPEFKKISVTGKKFDITNSDKHLKYGQRFSTYYCKQFGFAVVDGIFTLNDDAKVRFMFSDSNGDYVKNISIQKQAQIGIVQINFDRQNLKKENLGRIFMDENGNIWKEEKKRQGSIKIVINQDYYVQYRAEKRLLMIRKAETAVQLELNASIQGSFRFFVALSNLQVQIK